MKSLQDLAREAGLYTHKEVQPELQRFATLVIEAEHKRLLAGSGEPVAWSLWWREEPEYFTDDYISKWKETVEDEFLPTVIGNPDVVGLYTADQMTAAVLLKQKAINYWIGKFSDLEKERNALAMQAAHDVCTIESLNDKVGQLEAELQEQARVNGMGGEREAALMAKVEQLTAERNFYPRCGKRLVGDGIHTCTPPHNIETDPAKIRAAFEGDDE